MPTRLASATVTLPSDTEILITRSFEAPAALVWATLTEPRHLLRWWGPSWCPLVSCQVDLRVGGDWRYVARSTEGNELGWHGTYIDIVTGHRIESTEVFEGFPDAESTNVMTLTETDGVTTLRTLVRHRSTENRNGHVQSGMEAGMQETFDRLDGLLDASGTAAERFRRVAGRFTDIAAGVADDAWERPAPCEGWVARDIVRHMVSWVPHVIGRGGLDFAGGPSVDRDPLGAWRHLDTSLQAALDDPEVAARRFDAGPPGELSIEAAIGMIVMGDVLVHTWDLATATGQQVELDPVIVPEMLAGMEPLDEMLRASGHYGPRVAVDDDADDQTKLVAFTGRRPV